LLFDRRRFLKSIGIISGGTLVSCDVMAPREKLAAYLTPPVEMIPGKAAFYATICRACPAGCGILVKTREGRPIKLEGNPAHPINRGRLCARGQAFVQDLYSPQRIEKPLVREGGAKKETEWRSALTVVSKTLSQSRSVGFITGLESSTFDALITDFCGGFSSSGHVSLEPMSLVSMAAASELVFGIREVPRIDLTDITHVVSLGADFLDTWLSPVELSRQWVERHAVKQGRKLQLDYIGPHRNLTATSADRWHRLRASQVSAVALGVLRGVLEKKQDRLDSETAGLVSTALQKLSKGSQTRAQSD
jgi:hypothetical protein